MYAQYVKNTMEPLNIPDVCKDRRFPWTVSKIIFVIQKQIFLFYLPFKSSFLSP